MDIIKPKADKEIMEKADKIDGIKEIEYLVSIYMTTFYHEKYIAQAIESILSQRVTFLYEIIICDDCSKDKTQEIIKEYASEYSFIKYYFNEKNIGLTKNVFQAKTKCSGKYIIQLSGDDYWIDDYKLQKQVDFLEKNNEYIGVATRIESREEFSQKRDFVVPKTELCKKPFTIEQYLKGINYPTNGLMLRNVINDHYDLFSIMPEVSQFIDDETDCFLILLIGNIFILDDITVAYRRRIGQSESHNFNSINTGISKFEKHISLLNNLYDKFGNDYNFFSRYKIALGPEILKHYRVKTAAKMKTIISSIPENYRNQGLVIKSLLYDVEKAYDVLSRKFRE